MDVLKDKLRDEYTSAKIRSFYPLPRSSVELQVEDIYVELLLTGQDAAVRFYDGSDNHKAVFLPVDADHEYSWDWDDVWPDLEGNEGMDARYLFQIFVSKYYYQGKLFDSIKFFLFVTCCLVTATDLRNLLFSTFSIDAYLVENPIRTPIRLRGHSKSSQLVFHQFF